MTILEARETSAGKYSNRLGIRCGRCHYAFGQRLYPEKLYESCISMKLNLKFNFLEYQFWSGFVVTKVNSGDVGQTSNSAEPISLELENIKYCVPPINLG